MNESRPLKTGAFTRRLALWIGLYGTIVLACAISVTPSGGPEDKRAPAIISTAPAGDSAGVSPQSEISITFSEDMTRTGADKLVSLSPEVEFESVDWDGKIMKLKPARPLHSDTTYLVTVKPGYKDNHKVTSTAEFKFAFATAASIDSGAVSGRVFFRREPTEKGVVRCVRLPKDSAYSLEISIPDRIAYTDKEGKYTITYLPTNGSEFVLWAFEDANGNGYFGRDKEVGWALNDTFTLTPGQPEIASRDIYIVDPKEPAVLTGLVNNLTGLDTFVVHVALDAVNDSTPPTHLERCKESGEFEFGRVMAGSYVLRAFIDFFPDSLCGSYPCFGDSSTLCFEPCALYPDTIVLRPGDELKLDPIILQAAVKPTGENGEN